MVATAQGLGGVHPDGQHKRADTPTWEGTTRKSIHARRDILLAYLDLPFDQRKEDFSRLFEGLDTAMATHQSDAAQLIAADESLSGYRLPQTGRPETRWACHGRLVADLPTDAETGLDASGQGFDIQRYSQWHQDSASGPDLHRMLDNLRRGRLTGTTGCRAQTVVGQHHRRSESTNCPWRY